MIESDKLENFERAFSNGSAGCRRTCNCGITYFDDGNGGWDWEEGEREALRRATEAPNGSVVALDYAPGDMGFEGREFVNACDCWHGRAEQIMAFLDAHARKVAEYLSLEKKRKQSEAESAPTVE